MQIPFIICPGGSAATTDGASTATACLGQHPVNAISKVNDTIIASSADDTVNLHTNNFLTMMDNVGVNREESLTL